MSGPLPQYRPATRVTDRPKLDREGNPVTKLVVDKQVPPRKGERPTYTHKEVQVFQHEVVARTEQVTVSKHAKGRGEAQRQHLVNVAIRKQVNELMKWMQETGKSWADAVDEGRMPRQVAENLNLIPKAATNVEA
jgi:hypothetical protein